MGDDDRLSVAGSPEVLTDLVGFLDECPAFAGVDGARLERLAARAEIAYVPEGDEVDEALLDSALVVQRGALLARDAGGRTIDLVATGDFRAPASGERLEAVASSLVVVVPADAVDLAWSVPARDLRARLRPRGRDEVDLQTAAVRQVMSAPIVTATTGERCRDVAARMREHRIASVVVLGSGEPGIVTHRDLCHRLVAVGASADDPIESVATFPVRTIDAGAPMFQALVEMLSLGFHHLPVTEGGRIVGMCSASDLLQLHTRSPMYLRKQMDAASDVDMLAAALRAVPDAVAALLDAGTTSADVCRIVTAVTDRVVHRLLALAADDLGAAPAPFSWLAFGSQARQEQTLHTDQDSGLLLPDGTDDEARAWFARLGAWMTEALERCGYPRCAGGVMASEPDWRRTAPGWRERFGRWIAEPTQHAILGAEIAFDQRTVTGELDSADVLAPVLREARRHGIFLAFMAREAVRHRPPLGFLGRFTLDRSGEHAGTFDVKAGALLPIADLARLHTLARGGVEVSTHARLDAAAADGEVSDDLAATLSEGYRLALRVRLEGQLAALEAGRDVADRVDPDALSPLVRSQLREVFKAVRVAQDTVERRYAVHRLG